jgi:hypothetical protein
VSEVDLSRDVTVRTFGFNVPCRRFVLAAKVTRDRRMPLVDEFVLRALKLTEQLPLANIAAFFGFSDSEVQTVIADLSNRSLVVVEGEIVRLHSAANEMFRTSGDGVPTVLEVESWVEILWFDLISANMIAHGIRRGKHLIEINAPGLRAKVSIDFARAAFEDNFRDYLKHYRKINNPDAFALYAVTDVQPSQYGFVALGGREELVLQPEPRLQAALLETPQEQPQRLRKLSEAMRRAYDGLTNPEPSAAARSEYSKLTDSTTLQGAMRTDGTVDLERWQHEERVARHTGVATLIGAASLERNRQSLRRLIDEKPKSESTGVARIMPELVWVRPAGSAWGATDDLRGFLADVRAAARHGSDRPGTLRTTLVFPAAERASGSQRFNRLFDQGLLAPAGYLTPAVEVILLRGVAAVVLVWIPLSQSCAVWVGRATNRRGDVQIIEDRLDFKGVQNRSQRLWPGPARTVA